MLTSIIGLAIYTLYRKRRDSIMKFIRWVKGHFSPWRSLFFGGTGIGVLFAILILTAVWAWMGERYESYPQILKTFIILTIIVGSMGLVLISVSLYLLFHWWTDLNKNPCQTKPS